LATALSSAGQVGRGAGYDSGGSQLVRQLQLRLKKLGHDPGPVDGLFGPLTEGAVMRFQEAHELVVDGVVGSHTRGKLVGRRVERPAREVEPPARSRPAAPAEPKASPEPKPSAEPKPSPEPKPTAEPRASGDPKPSTEAQGGLAPAYAALLGALAATLVLSVLAAARRRRARRRAPERGHERRAVGRLNVGLACAALLGVFALGAAAGAIFASRSAPDASDERSGNRRVTTVEPLAPRDPVGAQRSRARRPEPRRPAARAARRPAPPRVHPAPPVPAPTATAAPARPQVEARTYEVRSGDALWPIAERQLGRGSTNAEIARRVARIAELNDERITSGNPDVIVAGERLKLP
jgi:peptidoglycan hydrolase-like protein with peptidoglycan-binding domain